MRWYPKEMLSLIWILSTIAALPIDVQSSRNRQPFGPTTCSEIRNLAGQDPNTWIVGDELWDLIENDLQLVVNCAVSGDVVLFNTTSPITPVGRTEVAKNLTFRGYTKSPSGDSRTDVYATLRCPSGEGLFSVKGQRVVFSDLQIEKCNLDSDQALGIIEVDECNEESSVLSVELSRVRFVENTLDGVSAVSAASGKGKCANIQMSNVAFSANLCAKFCLAYLGKENSLKNIFIRDNKAMRVSEKSDSYSILFLEKGTSTIATQIEATGNEVSVLYVKRSRMILSNSTFEDNSESTIQAVRSTQIRIKWCFFRRNKANDGAGVFLQYVKEPTIIGSRFEGNEAELGGAIWLQDSPLNMTRSEIIGNKARKGGGIFGDADGRVLMDHVVFANNSADEVGGGVHIEAPLLLTNSECHWNQANLGGCGYLGGKHDMRLVNIIATFNSASNSAGIFVFFEANATISGMNATFNNARYGGVIRLTEGSTIWMDHSVVLDNTASEYGAAFLMDDSLSTLVLESCLIANSTSPSGAGIYVKGNLTVRESSLISNNAKTGNGGAIHATGANITIESSYITGNRAFKSGGGIAGFRLTRLLIRNTTIKGNGAEDGAGLYLYGWQNTSFLRASRIEDNTANYRGGGICAVRTKIDIDDVHFKRNSATDGGSIALRSAQMKLQNSFFVKDKAYQMGGSLFAITDNGPAPTFQITNTSVKSSRANKGGGMWLHRASGTARGMRIEKCFAKEAGGGFKLAESSGVELIECVIANNSAAGKGGGVAISGSPLLGMSLQVKNSSFWNNEAQLGGGIYFLRENELPKCATEGTICTFIALIGVEFIQNQAGAGGAIFASQPSSVKVDCDLNRDPEETPDLSKLRPVTSLSAVCDYWNKSENIGRNYGPVISSYPSTMRRFRGEPRSDGSLPHEIVSNRYLNTDYESGDSLPTLFFRVFDLLGQGPAYGNQTTVSAHMTCPELFNGSVVVSMDQGEALFKGISGFSGPGSYDVIVSFDSGTLHSWNLDNFTMTVIIKKCSVGYTFNKKLKVCSSCGTNAYNLNPAEGGCKACPQSSNCSTNFIFPQKDFYSRHPCALKVSRCITADGCNYDERNVALQNAIEGRRTCGANFSMYKEKQCKEGYESVACGSCSDDYGQMPNLECAKCGNPAGTVALITAVVLILTILAAFAIKSSIVQGQPLSRSHRQVDESPQSSDHYSLRILDPNSTTLSDDSVEKGDHDGTLTRNLSQEAEMEKVKTLEIFKITLNFLQVISIAMTVNADWSYNMLELLRVISVTGASTSDALLFSIDCVFRSTGIPLVIARTIVNLSVPFFVACCFCVFWFVVAIKSKESWYFLYKRCRLSIITVAYLAYVSITKTTVSLINCTGFFDSEDYLSSEKSSYWVHNTSQRCYEGGHLWMASIFGWPFSILFSIGFPVGLMIVLLRTRSSGRASVWLAEARGFLARAYTEKFIYWESLIMLRKGLLTVIAIFGYTLGVNRQMSLVTMVLMIAIFAQVSCRPFKSELDSLNGFESASLFVSSVTFVSGLLFNDEFTSKSWKAVITFFVFSLISGLCFCLLRSFVRSVIRYLRLCLENEGFEAQKWSAMRVIVVSSKSRAASVRDQVIQMIPVHTSNSEK